MRGAFFRFYYSVFIEFYFIFIESDIHIRTKNKTRG